MPLAISWQFPPTSISVPPPLPDQDLCLGKRQLNAGSALSPPFSILASWLNVINVSLQVFVFSVVGTVPALLAALLACLAAAGLAIWVPFGGGPPRDTHNEKSAPRLDLPPTLRDYHH